MERKFLEELGLEKEVINKVLDAHSADVGKHLKAVEAAEAERDGLKTQLNDVETKLKDFDGVDVADLKGQITKLQEDLSAADQKRIEELAAKDFSALLDRQVLSAKAKDADLVVKALDVETLKQSKNQEKDITDAIAALQESKSYLFDDEEDTSARINSKEHSKPSSTEVDEFTAAALKGAGLEKEGEK